MNRKLQHQLSSVFRLLGDPSRLGVVLACRAEPEAVGDIAAAAGLSLALTSHHLRLLRTAGLVEADRRGRHVYYQVADKHITQMLENMMAHAEHGEPAGGVVKPAFQYVASSPSVTALRKVVATESCETHKNHRHKHGPACGHTAIKHAGHVDYLHDGHLHHVHGGHVDEHVIAVSAKNPAACKAVARAHDKGHKHGKGCGHEAIPHGDHVDYLVDGRLHHPHGRHCDDHGAVEVVQG